MYIYKHTRIFMELSTWDIMQTTFCLALHRKFRRRSLFAMAAADYDDDGDDAVDYDDYSCQLLYKTIARSIAVAVAAVAAVGIGTQRKLQRDSTTTTAGATAKCKRRQQNAIDFVV